MLVLINRRCVGWLIALRAWGSEYLHHPTVVLINPLVAYLYNHPKYMGIAGTASFNPIRGMHKSLINPSSPRIGASTVGLMLMGLLTHGLGAY